jgi:hypothetical protein
MDPVPKTFKDKRESDLARQLLACLHAEKDTQCSIVCTTVNGTGSCIRVNAWPNGFVTTHYSEYVNYENK